MSFLSYTLGTPGFKVNEEWTSVKDEGDHRMNRAARWIRMVMQSEEFRMKNHTYLPISQQTIWHPDYILHSAFIILHS